MFAHRIVTFLMLRFYSKLFLSYYLMQDYIVIYYCLRCCVENNKNRNNFVKQWHKE
uniref:Uncharacterized protein n=1 Tax=Papilio xuthus TaxID=66420 RepID=I4DLR6_PAPXU|nr:unknown unsecreted protein [Papilio xuthus]